MDPLETPARAAGPTTRARAAPRRWWPWLLAILAVAAGALAFTLMPGGDAQQQQARQGGRRQGFDPSRPMPVVAVPAKTGEIGVTIAGLGTVTPLATVTV